MQKLMVMQPDGTLREGTVADWSEYADALRVQADMWHEIADIERALREHRALGKSQ